MKNTTLVTTIGICLLFSCNNDNKVNEKNNESYTVIKQDGQEKLVTTDYDEAIVQASDLPEKATQFLKNNFGSETIQNSIKEKDVNGDEYKIQLSNGIKIDFDANGDWKEIKSEVANQSIGAIFLPQVTRDYLTKNHPQIEIKSVDKDAKGIDIELSNNIDLKFDLNGNFLRKD